MVTIEAVEGWSSSPLHSAQLSQGFHREHVPLVVPKEVMLRRGRIVACACETGARGQADVQAVRESSGLAAWCHSCICLELPQPPGEGAAYGSCCLGLGLADPLSGMFPVSWCPLFQQPHFPQAWGHLPDVGLVCLVSASLPGCVLLEDKFMEHL